MIGLVLAACTSDDAAPEPGEPTTVVYASKLSTPALCTGIHRGPIVRSRTGAVAGEAITIAAEVRKCARAGEIVVSRTAAERLWPGENPIGQVIRPAGAPDVFPWITVGGVVEDVILADFREQTPEPLLYLPMVGPTVGPQSAWGVGTPAYVVRSPRAHRLAPEVRALIQELTPGAPMYRVFTMEELANRSMARLRFTMLSLAIAAALALVLGAVGIYGTISYVVSRRTREIGNRIARGAQAADVVGHRRRTMLERILAATGRFWDHVVSPSYVKVLRLALRHRGRAGTPLGTGQRRHRYGHHPARRPWRPALRRRYSRTDLSLPRPARPRLDPVGWDGRAGTPQSHRPQRPRFAPAAFREHDPHGTAGRSGPAG